MTAWIAAASPGTTARAAAGRASVRPDLWPCFSIRAHCGSRDGQLRAEAMRSMASAGTASPVPSSAARSRFLLCRTVVRVRVRRGRGRGTHCVVARHLRYVGSPATQGRSPGVAAGEHRV